MGHQFNKVSRQSARALALPAALDLRSATDLKDRLAAALERDAVLRLNGSKTTQVSTPGVQVLLAAAQTAKTSGGALLLHKPSSALKEAFHDLGLSGRLTEWEAADA